MLFRRKKRTLYVHVDHYRILTRKVPVKKKKKNLDHIEVPNVRCSMEFVLRQPRIHTD